MPKPEKNKKQHKKYTLSKNIIWFFLIILFIATGMIIIHLLENQRPAEIEKPEASQIITTPLSAHEEEPSPPADNADLPMIAIIIDDLGGTLDYFDELLGIDMPLTFAILPNRRFTDEAVMKARNRGFEILLHLPMEPDDYPFSNPGKDAIFTFMSEEQIEEAVERGLRSVSCAVGVNNHMGSRVTRDPRIMRAVFGILKAHDLFFIDSRTTKETQAYHLAKKMGLRADSRSVFLDVEADEAYVTNQMHILIEKARESGYAIAIGHNNEATVTVLKEINPSLAEMGVRPVFCSRLPSLAREP